MSAKPPARRRGPLTGRLAEAAPEDRPREKLFARGPGALTDEELIALVLGTGRAGRPVLEMARDLLARGGLSGLLSRGPADLLLAARGVGTAKAARLAAVLEIARRHLESSLAGRDLMGDPEAAARYLMVSLAAEAREVVGALLLDAKNRLLRDAVVFRGAVGHASVAPAPLFREAILSGASGLVLYHNHPSGDPEPSAQDGETTRRFAAAGQEIGIPLLDHLVVGQGRWFSFHRAGRLA